MCMAFLSSNAQDFIEEGVVKAIMQGNLIPEQ